tara:strand:+ start:940 stop:1074 length:135 start_codon:yes stop_codon:yes gene_type:complete
VLVVMILQSGMDNAPHAMNGEPYLSSKYPKIENNLKKTYQSLMI